MNRIFVLFFSLVAVGLGGCTVSTPSTISYVKPDFSNANENQVIVAASFDDSWNQLIAGLSADFFVINNIEKASGLITLDFSGVLPEQFVDCGVTSRTYGERAFKYEVAGDAEFLLDQKYGVNVARKTIQRNASLNGKINVHVSEVSEGTRVTVNARYMWSVIVGGTYRLAGSLATGPSYRIDSETYTKTFNSNSASVANGPNDFTCGATGFLEKKILSIIH
ncbi:MAG: hypothetical protein ACJAXN_001665 [Psychromonas sp.]|jgi:hypothetical protein